VKKLIIKIVCLALLQVPVVAGLLYFYRVDDRAFLAASRDKHALLERPAASPRIIFVGGSNVAFGVNSDMVAKDLPYEPVNLALHAGVGLLFMLREAEQSVRAGDVVVVSPEYQHFTGRRAGVLLQLLEQRPASVRYVPLAFIPTLLDHGINYAGGVVRHAVRHAIGRPYVADARYSRDAFNRYGDVVAHWRLPRPSRLNAFRLDPYSATRMEFVIGQLNGFHDRVRARGARVFFAYPTIPASTFSEHREPIEEIEAALQRSLTIPVLNRAEAATLPRDFFFDTHYHLTEPGSRRRTRLLIDSLRSSVDSMRSSALSVSRVPG
jgi:hypothetical protein